MSADHAVDRTAPRWPRLVVVRGLLPLGILGALALSAAATVDMAARNHVPDGTAPGTIDVQPFAVGMVEVVSIAGTLLAIFGTRKGTRLRGMVAVAGLGFVQLIAGAKAYGWFGLIAPIAAVYLVHLAAEAWRELRDETPVVAGSSTALEPEVDDQPVAELVEAMTTADEVPADELASVLDEPVAAPALPRPVPAGPMHGPWSAPVGPVEGPLTLVDHLRSLPDHKRPSERVLLGELNEGVEEELQTTRHRVKGALREARTGLREVA